MRVQCACNIEYAENKYKLTHTPRWEEKQRERERKKRGDVRN